MARGGARKGAGRKKGVTEATKARRELAQRVSEEGVTPLEVMLTTMRGLWDEGTVQGKPNIAKRMQAVAIAEKVAPYVHPKLAAIEHTGKDGGPIETASIVTNDPVEAAKAYQRIVGGG